MVIGRGRLIADELMGFADRYRNGGPRPGLQPLAAAYDAAHWTGEAELTIPGVPPEQVGATAHRMGLRAAWTGSHRDDARGVLHEADGRQPGVRGRGMTTDAPPAAATTAATAAAEWLKLRSVRSTWWFVGGATAVMLLTTSLEVDEGAPVGVHLKVGRDDDRQLRPVHPAGARDPRRDQRVRGTRASP